MGKYIGVKIIEAETMNIGDYNKFKGWKIPENENPSDEGYKVVYPDGYISWSPKYVFEDAYRLTTGMTFGLAVEASKQGLPIMRDGWNGKGMLVYYVPENEYPSTTDIAKEEFGDTVKYNAYLAIKNVNGTVSTWVPSINDVLANDWRLG